MSIAPIKAGGWSPLDRVGSAQLNDFQAKLIQAGDDIDAAETDIAAAEAAIAAETTARANADTALDARLDDLEDWHFYKPEHRLLIREDFAGAIFDASGSRIDASFPWRTGGSASGVVSVVGRNDGSRHFGVLDLSIPGNGSGDLTFYFQPHGATEGFLNPATMLKQATITCRITDDPANVNTILRVGLVQNNSILNGGDNEFAIFWQKLLHATNVYLVRRNDTVQADAVILGSMTNDLYFTVHFQENAAGDAIDVYFNNGASPATSVPKVDLPVAEMTFGAFLQTTSSDAEVFNVGFDFLYLHGKSSRHGV